MSKVLVLYYSSYGHVEEMARAVAEGARECQSEVSLKRVPELVPVDVAREAGFKLEQDAPLAEVSELPDYDAIIFGTPTRYGNMCAQMRNFLDQTGKLWQQGAMNRKVGSAFTSTATQHGGQETTLTSFHTTLLHLGMIVVGLDYSASGLSEMGEVSGGTPYGATTMVGPDHSRWPSQNELSIARFQGRRVAEITEKLCAT